MRDCLKKESHRELNLTIGNACVRDPPGLTRGVREVEKLGAKLEAVTLSEREGSINQEIEVDQTRDSYHIACGVAVAVEKWDGEARNVVPGINGPLTGIEVAVADAVRTFGGC